jgi:hypothetical protein
MKHIQSPLGSAIGSLSDKTYEQSLAYFRFWFGIVQTHSQIPSDLIFNTIFGYRAAAPLHPNCIHPAAHLILRLTGDAESDSLLAPHSTGLRSRFCAGILREFFDNDLFVVYNGQGDWNPSPPDSFYADANLIAHCANLGYIEEDTIRNHIIQSLISHSKLYDHQVAALAILFKIAGATFGAYVDPVVVDRCFEVLKNYPLKQNARVALRQVSAFSVQKPPRN